jgi:hypothetical protein
MKRSLFFFITACSAFLLGCGDGRPRDLSEAVKNAKNKSEFPMKHPEMTTPEFMVANTETQKDRADMLRELAKDPKFDPKQHVEMLKKYANDSDSDIATAAKELLTKVQ